MSLAVMMGSQDDNGSDFESEEEDVQDILEDEIAMETAEV
jgi:hypothetical protein